MTPARAPSTTLTVTSPASAADGFYTIPVAATNGADASYTASASATVVIAAALNVAVPTNQPSYTRAMVIVSATIPQAAIGCR